MFKKNISRAFSIILAVVMLAVSMPFAFAVDPIALTTSNVTEWPTISYKSPDGVMYFGQSIGDAVTLNGGKVVYNGTAVPGHFEFIDPTLIPDMSGTQRSNLKFVPDDVTAFTGFEKKRSRDVTFEVSETTPVFVDEINDPVVATEVEANDTLSASILSGGKMINPYNSEEPNILAATWKWRDSSTVVKESGYYEARIVAGGYAPTYTQVYVRIAGEIPETTITEKPTVDEQTYDGTTTWGDVELKGGKAALKIEGDEVEGTFAVTDFWKTRVVNVGSYEIDVVFTPADPEAALPYSFKIPVTVNKGTVKFVDESGEEIVPEITLPYGFKVGDDLNGYLKEYLNVSASFNYTETEGYGELIVPGTHEYEVKTSSSDKNFEGTTLKFKVTVNQAELELKVKDVVGGKQIYIEGGDTYHLNGNFDVKYFIDGKEAGTIEGVKFNETFEVKQDKSGVYTYEIVYNEAENDPYKVTKVTAAADDIKLQHSVKINGNEPVVYTYGEKVTVTAPAHEKPYYEFTGWSDISGITLSEEQLANAEITLSMPDNDVELKANYKFSFKLFIEWIFAQIISFFTFIANAVKDLFALV